MCGVQTYGDPSSAKFVRAQKNFAKSWQVKVFNVFIFKHCCDNMHYAGYSIVTYLLQIKDRHNGNILIDRDGHLIHIDFGFILSNTPGNIGFEAAPFKLPPEYVEVLEARMVLLSSNSRLCSERDLKLHENIVIG